MKHLLKDANGSGNNTPFIDLSSNTVTFKSGVGDRIKDSMVLWYDIKRQGATNEAMAANPKLIDLSGNGHDATCYNFAWSGMSGIGGYNIDYTTGHIVYDHRGTLTRNSTTINITNVVESYNLIETNSSGVATVLTVPSYKIKVTGIPENAILIYKYYIDENDTLYSMTEDGEYTLPASTYEHVYVGFQVRNFTGDCNIVIEQIPEYPNALVADGVDDYAFAQNTPLLDDYTIIVKRKWINNVITLFGNSICKGSVNGAFLFERTRDDSGSHYEVYSYGAQTSINILNNDITYQTPSYYNNQKINKGNTEDLSDLILFARNIYGFQRSNMAIYSVLLFNRTLTTKEINWVKHNLIEGDTEL